MSRTCQSIHRIAECLVIVTIVLYAPAMNYGFVNFDDRDNFEQNYRFRGLSETHLYWMWTTTHMGPYQPLSWMSLAADYMIWGEDAGGHLNPRGFHLTNLLLHSANVVLVFLLSNRFLLLCNPGCRQTQQSALAKPDMAVDSPDNGNLIELSNVNLACATLSALLFGLHPLRVEVVAWITERRELLSTMFTLSALLAYMHRLERNSAGRMRSYYYQFSVFLFVLALCSKAMAITFPLVILLLNIFPFCRLSQRPKEWFTLSAGRCVLREIIPFAIVSIPFAVVAFVGQHSAGTLASWEAHPLASRLAQCCFGLIFYLYKEVLPLGLAPLYPLFLPVDPVSPPFSLSIIAVIGITSALWRYRSVIPGALVAWLACCILASPVLGMSQAGRQIAADRYTYLPCIPFALLAGGFVRLIWLASCETGYRYCANSSSLRARRHVIVAVAIFICLMLCIRTRSQLRVWESSLSLWQHTCKVTCPNPQAEVCAGLALLELGRNQEAERHFRHAADGYSSWKAQANCLLGDLLYEQGDGDGAISCYTAASQSSAEAVTAFNKIGIILDKQGNHALARSCFEKCVKMDLSLVDEYMTYADGFFVTGQDSVGVDHYLHALKLHPTANGHRRLAARLKRQMRRGEAIEQLRAAFLFGGGESPTEEKLSSELERL